MGNKGNSPLAKYKLGDDLGEGGQGEVFEATHKKTGRAFAIK